MTAKAILVGNGINYDSGAPGWRDVVTRFGTAAGVNFGKGDFEHVPFSLLSDQVFCKGRDAWREYRDILVDDLRILKPSEAHHAIAGCGVREVLTINYDLTIEKAAGVNEEDVSNQGWSTESKYSQFRHFRMPSGQRVWHIHGDMTVPGSILLGYERYLGYVQVIRQTLTEGRVYRSQQVGPWRKLPNGNGMDVWPMFLFDHDVLMVGLGLDFAETHLWWLLSYRAAKRNDPTLSSFPRNRIAFVWNEEIEKSARAQAIVRQLEAFDVEIIRRRWSKETWNAGYADVIRKFGEGKL